MKSETHSWLSRSAKNHRLTRSSGHGAFMSLIVVRITLQRRTPCKPDRFIKRSTVQRATPTPSRFICFQILPDALDVRRQGVVPFGTSPVQIAHQNTTCLQLRAQTLDVAQASINGAQRLNHPFFIYLNSMKYQVNIIYIV